MAVELLSRPDYLTIKSITDTFNYFNVENLAFDTPKENLDKLPQVFLVGVIDNNINGFALAEIRQNEGLLQFSKTESRIVNKNSFLELWSGIAIVIEEGAKRNFKTKIQHR